MTEIEQMIQVEQTGFNQQKNYKIKNGVKILSKLEELTYFQVGNFFTEDQTNQIKLWRMIQDLFSLNLDDRVMFRLLYFFTVNYLNLEGGDLDSFIFILKKDLNSLPIKIETLQVLNRIIECNGARSMEAYEMMRSISIKWMKKLVESEKEEKKSIMNKLFSKTDTLKEEDVFILKAILHSFKNIESANNNEEELKEILLCIRHKNEEISKEAIILLWNKKYPNLKEEILPKFKLEEKKNGSSFNFKYSIEIMKE
jgi:hypothetical protein